VEPDRRAGPLEKGQGWRVHVVHTTRIGYRVPVRDSFNEARMTPPTLPSQVVVDSEVLADGKAPVRTYLDRWGNQVSVFEVMRPHSELLIRATATVETCPPAPLPVPSAATGPKEYLLPTALTALDAELIAGSDVHGTAEMICAAVRERVRYLPWTTRVGTSASQAWRQGSGVCQDIAHVTIGLLRAADVPARYVSGYLCSDPGAAPGQTHAWVEYWAGGWVPCDPTIGEPVGERHVVVARGRDYSDVPPLKGVYQGPPENLLSVTVEVTRLT
jgi:transglutaminase-like putative cysteine protease